MKMSELKLSGWSYRLASHQVLCSRPQTNNLTEQVVIIKSGKAFPPGHPTTRLCLDLLQQALNDKFPGSLLDVGCGSGVVSLAAAALGVQFVVGVDLFWEAARITQKNAQENNLAAFIKTIQGSTESIGSRFNTVVANLPWEVQQEKVQELDRIVTAAGNLILSGFRDDQEENLWENYQKLGWSLSRRITREFCHPELPPDISFTWVAWLLKKN